MKGVKRGRPTAGPRFCSIRNRLLPERHGMDNLDFVGEHAAYQIPT
jgi:hypothetical protein